MKVAEPY